jgi:hypothetical protein
MITRPAKIVVIIRTFLLIVNQAFRTVHFQNQLFHRNTIIHLIYPQTA